MHFELQSNSFPLELADQDPDVAELAMGSKMRKSDLLSTHPFSTRSCTSSIIWEELFIPILQIGN